MPRSHRTVNALAGLLAVCAVWLPLAAPTAFAQELVYDNTSTGTGSTSFTQLQIGDEVTLAGSGRVITQLVIGLTQQGFEGTGDLQARMYANDGSGGQPGSLLWESALFEDVEFTGGDDLIPFDVPHVEVPDTFTWTIQISNTEPVAVGLPHYSPPTVGSSPDYAWFGNGTPPWTKLDLTDPVDFMCQVYAGSSGPSLAVDFSACPGNGPIQVSWSGATPDRTIAILVSRDTGGFRVPSQFPCAGTIIDLNPVGLKIVYQGNSGVDGSGSIGVPNAPSAICGRYLQMIDITTCETSDVVQIQ